MVRNVDRNINLYFFEDNILVCLNFMNILTIIALQFDLKIISMSNFIEKCATKTISVHNISIFSIYEMRLGLSPGYFTTSDI